jgi:hypothetical protein
MEPRDTTTAVDPAEAPSEAADTDGLAGPDRESGTARTDTDTDTGRGTHAEPGADDTTDADADARGPTAATDADTSRNAGSPGATDPANAGPPGGRGRWVPSLRSRRWPATASGSGVTAVLGLTALLAVPLVVGLVVLREPRWLPLSDMAHIELFVRDVGTSHTPLYGPIGRIYAFDDVGNHPGPLPFYALAPVYRLLGADGWSLQAATVSVVVGAAAVAVWLGFRRGGWPFALAVATTLALLMRGFGPSVLIEPWNPHLAPGWWLVFLLAAWSVLGRDLVALPVAVAAGSFCAQNHIAYLPLVGIPTAVLVAVLVLRLRRAHGVPDRAEWRRQLAWLAGSAGLLAVLWLPPVVQQVDPSPDQAGNMSLIANHLRHQEDLRYTIHEATTVWIAHLDVLDMPTGELAKPLPWDSTPLDRAGLGFLAAWLVTVALAWRRRHPDLLRLHAVAGLASALGWLAFVRLTGPPWPYLFYWAWVTSALMLLAAAWTLLSRGDPVTRHGEGPGEAAGDAGPEAVARDGGRVPPLRWVRPGLAGLAAVTVACVALLTVDARDVEMADAERSRTLGRVTGPTVERLGEDPAGCGDGCQVLVTWTDDATHGFQAMGLLAALERAGFQARMAPGMEEQVREHRTIRDDQADVEVHLAASPPAIAEWRGREGAELVASARPRDPAAAEPLAVFLVVRPRPATA